jgi:hypothetical protein
VSVHLHVRPRGRPTLPTPKALPCQHINTTPPTHLYVRHVGVFILQPRRQQHVPQPHPRPD